MLVVTPLIYFRALARSLEQIPLQPLFSGRKKQAAIDYPNSRG
jgi:hypothetical protein